MFQLLRPWWKHTAGRKLCLSKLYSYVKEPRSVFLNCRYAHAGKSSQHHKQYSPLAECCLWWPNICPYEYIWSVSYHLPSRPVQQRIDNTMKRLGLFYHNFVAVRARHPASSITKSDPGLLQRNSSFFHKYCLWHQCCSRVFSTILNHGRIVIMIWLD